MLPQCKINCQEDSIKKILSTIDIFVQYIHRDGSFDITIHCVQNVLTQCRGTPQENALKKTLDPDVMKKAFDTACEKKERKASKEIVTIWKY